MNTNRGDVVLVWYPHASGSGGSRRPALIIQNTPDNLRRQNTIVAQITTNLAHAAEPTQVFIDISTPEGAQTGLLHDSLISLNDLATIDKSRIARVIGALAQGHLQQCAASLKIALDLP